MGVHVDVHLLKVTHGASVLTRVHVVTLVSGISVGSVEVYISPCVCMCLRVWQHLQLINTRDQHYSLLMLMVHSLISLPLLCAVIS